MTLEHPRIRAGLEAVYPLPLTLDVFDELDSTNRYLQRELEAGRKRLGQHVCITHHQTAGSGRRGKQWVSPQDSITFSVLKHFSLPMYELMGLSLVTGIAVAGCLADNRLPALALKWPNDVLYDGRKLAGILTEITHSSARKASVITGVGINYTTPLLDSGLHQPVTSIAEISAKSPERQLLIGQLAGSVLAAFDAFESYGWRHFSERWCGLDTLAGRSVTVDDGRVRHNGTAMGVTERGALRLATGNGQEIEFYGGEVSVRAV